MVLGGEGMNIFLIGALLCGAALYLFMLGLSIRLIFAPLDPEVMFGGICLTLMLVGFPLLALGVM